MQPHDSLLQKHPSSFPTLFFSHKGLENLNQIEQGSDRIGSLYLGDVISVVKKDLILKHNITAILSCMSDFQHPIDIPPHITHMKIPAKDSLEYPLNIHFKETFAFISQMRNLGKNVLVHCHAGVSRSATIVCAYLMKKKQWSFNQAFTFLKEKRNRIRPNQNFLSLLKNYERQALASSNVSSNSKIQISLSIPDPTKNKNSFSNVYFKSKDFKKIDQVLSKEKQNIYLPENFRKQSMVSKPNSIQSVNTTINQKQTVFQDVTQKQSKKQRESQKKNKRVFEKDNQKNEQREKQEEKQKIQQEKEKERLRERQRQRQIEKEKEKERQKEIEREREKEKERQKEVEKEGEKEKEKEGEKEKEKEGENLDEKKTEKGKKSLRGPQTSKEKRLEFDGRRFSMINENEPFVKQKQLKKKYSNGIFCSLSKVKNDVKLKEYEKKEKMYKSLSTLVFIKNEKKQQNKNSFRGSIQDRVSKILGRTTRIPWDKLSEVYKEEKLLKTKRQWMEESKTNCLC